MFNIVIFGGSDGRFGWDIEFKYGIGKYLAKNWNVTIVSRVKEGRKFIKDENKVKFHYIFDDDIFKRKFSKKEIKEAEDWLGWPLRLIKHYSRGIKDITNKKIEEKNLELIAKLIIAWRNYFKKTILMCSLLH